MWSSQGNSSNADIRARKQRSIGLLEVKKHQVNIWEPCVENQQFLLHCYKEKWGEKGAKERDGKNEVWGQFLNIFIHYFGHPNFALDCAIVWWRLGESCELSLLLLTSKIVLIETHNWSAFAITQSRKKTNSKKWCIDLWTSNLGNTFPQLSFCVFISILINSLVVELQE